MFPATTLKEVCLLTSLRKIQSTPHKRRIIGLLFAKASSAFAQEQMMPHLKAFHWRAGLHIDFFCAGITRGDKRLAYKQFGKNDYEHPIIKDGKSIDQRGDNWLFSDAAFRTFCEEVASEM